MQLVEIPRALTDEEREELMDGEEDPFELADIVLPTGRRKDHYVALREQGRIVAAAGRSSAPRCAQPSGLGPDFALLFCPPMF
jgi:hypothetical protein